VSETLAERLSRIDIEAKGGEQSGWEASLFQKAIDKMSPQVFQRFYDMDDATLLDTVFGECLENDDEIAMGLTLIDQAISDFEESV
jgi:hypothetical protein